jgi:hypothetical protein
MNSGCFPLRPLRAGHSGITKYLLRVKTEACCLPSLPIQAPAIIQQGLPELEKSEKVRLESSPNLYGRWCQAITFTNVTAFVAKSSLMVIGLHAQEIKDICHPLRKRKMDYVDEENCLTQIKL